MLPGNDHASPYVVVCGAPGAGKTALLRRLAGFGAIELPAEDYAVELVTTASGADFALVVIDATQGVTTAGVRDRSLLSLFGISEVALAINKMDQVNFSEPAYRAIVAAYSARSPEKPAPVAIPVAALGGDNVAARSENMAWYTGPTLREQLGATAAAAARNPKPHAQPALESVADQVQATLVWLHDEPMFPGRSYLIEIGDQTLSGNVTALRHKLDLETSARLAARKLDAGEVGSCNLSLERALTFASFHESRATGGFVLRDESSRARVGVGLLHFALRRAHNLHRQAVDVDQRARAALKNQRPCVLWFTGLSASGKSTIANLVEKRLHALGRHTYLLDGDNVRLGLNKDLGFTDTDRVENIRRVAEVAKLMVDAGLIVLVSFISPFRAERRMARELVGPGEFLEVFVDTTLAEAERRDPKGLYRKARRGELQHFTGIDSPYEAPESPELRLDTLQLSPEAAAELVLERLEASS